MWTFNSNGNIRTGDPGNDFAIVSSITAIVVGLVIGITWLCIWTISTWGLVGLFGALLGCCVAWPLTMWVSYKIARRRWRAEEVKRRIGDAAR